MKRFSPSVILYAALLIASCAGPTKTALSENEEENLAQEAAADQVEHGYWKNPNVIYIAEVVPSGYDRFPPGGNRLSIRDVPALEAPFIDAAPKDRHDGLLVGELGVDGGDKDMIIKLAQELANGQHGKFDSMLISHKGKLLFESYFANGRVNLTHPQASVTKSHTGMALGRAMQLGYLTMADLDKPIISFLNDLEPAKFVDGAELVTLHQAMTMRSGIRISDQQTEAFQKNPDSIEGQALAQAIFEKSDPITAENLSAFSYGNYSSHLVMQVLDAVVPGTVEGFIKNEFLAKIGIRDYGWMTGLGGLPAAGWKSSFTSRAMMKVGTLAMNKGQWKGEQLIPETYVTKATSPILYNGDDDIYGGGKDVSKQGYGYFWWNAELKSGDKTYYSASAQGGGGQFIVLIEELDLIVVTTASMREPTTLQLVAERILPAFLQ